MNSYLWFFTIFSSMVVFLFLIAAYAIWLAGKAIDACDEDLRRIRKENN